MQTPKNLTIESIWRFGTQNPAVAYQMASILPPSLVKINLIDFWGMSGSNLKPRQCHYLEFSQGISPLKLMVVFQNRRRNYPDAFRNSKLSS